MIRKQITVSALRRSLFVAAFLLSSSGSPIVAAAQSNQSSPTAQSADSYTIKQSDGTVVGPPPPTLPEPRPGPGTVLLHGALENQLKQADALLRGDVECFNWLNPYSVPSSSSKTTGPEATSTANGPRSNSKGTVGTNPAPGADRCFEQIPGTPAGGVDRQPSIGPDTRSARERYGTLPTAGDELQSKLDQLERGGARPVGSGKNPDMYGENESPGSSGRTNWANSSRNGSSIVTPPPISSAAIGGRWLGRQDATQLPAL